MVYAVRGAPALSTKWDVGLYDGNGMPCLPVHQISSFHVTPDLLETGCTGRDQALSPGIQSIA